MFEFEGLSPEFLGEIEEHGDFVWSRLKCPTIDKCTQPDWLVELQIDWATDYANLPRFKALTQGDPFRFKDGPVWTKDGSRYYVKSSDGRLMEHYHSGALSWNAEAAAWQTTEQEVYGGRSFPIYIKAGSDHQFPWGRNKVILRGPWHQSPPGGYVDLYVREVKSDGCYLFGISVAFDVIIKCYQRFFPGRELLVTGVKSRRNWGCTVLVQLEALPEGREKPKDLEALLRREQYRE